MKLEMGDDPKLRDIFDEVVTRDCYGLRGLKKRGLDVQRAVDIGASFGPAAALIAELWPDAGIEAYEPDDKRFSLLTANTPERCVCWNQAIIPFEERHVGFDGGPWRRSPADAWDMLRKMNCYWERVGIENGPFATHVDLLKIDNEGFEWGIVEDLARNMVLPTVIVGEWHFANALGGLAAALADTHDFKFDKPGPEPWGPFVAVRRGALP
ncbi:MAG: hypothetical protein EBR86_16880 [Planctomycetia bacterium]|nr:hypothetical protein [Planctomycetia bacterium]